MKRHAPSFGICALLAALALPCETHGNAGGEGAEAYYVDASLDFAGRLLDWRFLDLDQDGVQELVVAVAPRSGERELRVHRLRSEGLVPEPEWRINLLADVLAWGAADVRAEPGKELLFLTRSGIWSYSLTLPGYRDNVRPLVRAESLYDLADPRALEYWSYVLPTPGGDLVLFPGPEGLGLYGPARAAGTEKPAEQAPYDLRAFFPAAHRTAQAMESEHEKRTVRIGGGVSTSPASMLFLQENPRRDAALFEESFRYDAPALVDLDGDGLLDLVRIENGELLFHRGSPAGPAAEPTRREALTGELGPDKGDSVDLTLLDLDGDRDLDLLAQIEGDVDGLENAPQRLLVYLNDGKTLLREKPDQVLSFEAAMLRVDVTDVDGDGRVDLALRKLELPSMVGIVTGLTFTFSHLVYLGERRGFARRPVLKQETTYDENSIVEIAANRELKLDCDGDGVADLVELDLQGGISIRRLRKRSSFLGGDEWSLEPAPWKHFATGGAIESLHVEDYNGDGLGDIVSDSEHRLTLLLSVRARGNR